jgi:hypothetical protein
MADKNEPNSEGSEHLAHLQVNILKMGKIVELKPQENPGGWGGSDIFGSSLFLCLISFLIKSFLENLPGGLCHTPLYLHTSMLTNL